MRLFFKAKDGGDKSTVTGYWLIESKSLFSIVLLRFDGQSREVFHTHAFHCLSWVLKGGLWELFLDRRLKEHGRSWFPFLTSRNDFHQVSSTVNRTWVFSIRGPWARTWWEQCPKNGDLVKLGKGRVELERIKGWSNS